MTYLDRVKEVFRIASYAKRDRGTKDQMKSDQELRKVLNRFEHEFSKRNKKK